MGPFYVDVSAVSAFPIRNQMGRFHSYLNSATAILNLYKGEMPFSIFLKSYFSKQKKFGSRDRKEIGHLCYSYFRIGQSLQQCPIDERILCALFVCERHPKEMLSELKPEWNEVIALAPPEKYSMLGVEREDIFPWKSELSSGIEYTAFVDSFLVQPDLYIRIRPGQGEYVKRKLHSADIAFNEITHNCYSLNNATQLEKVLELNREVVIQDYSSQRVGELLDFVRSSFTDPSTPLRVYDCCAASGGKSILAYDILGDIDLTISDIRESILTNLTKRFKEAGIRKYNAFVRDLSSKKIHAVQNEAEQFDLVICDAPCSGSGTWSRTPEQLYYFNDERIGYYAGLQENILENVIPFIRPDGYLLYITCSVFEKENEQQVQFLQKEFQFELKKMELLKGYDKKADSMFVALLKRSDLL